MKTMDFNFHNIVKMRIIQKDEGLLNNLAKRIFSTIDIEYDAFKVRHVNDPDITVIVGKFTPSNKDCYLIDHKYYIKKNYIYFEDVSTNGAKWETELTGFENKKITVKINCRNKRAYMVILGYIVEFLINYLMLQKDYVLVHAAGVTKNNQAYVFPARGSAGKTTLTLNLVYKGYGYLGDDYVILHKNQVLSYGTWLHVFNYHLNHKTKVFKDYLSRRQRAEIKLRYLFYLFTKKKLLYKLRIKDMIPKAELEKISKLKSLIFVIRKNNIKKPIFRKISKEEAIERLVTDMKLECYYSTRYYLYSYSFVFPQSKLVKHWERLRNYSYKNFKNTPFYVMEVPEYSPQVIENIYNFIERL